MSPPVVVRALTSAIALRFDDSISATDQDALIAPWRELLTDETATRLVRARSSLAAAAQEPADAGWESVRDVVGTSHLSLATQLTTAITLEAITGLKGEALLFHANAIALDDGRVIGFVGPSGRGKTTASRALCERFAYVTDETLAVRGDLSVIPYPKPLSIVNRPEGKDQRAAHSLGLRTTLPAELRLAALVLLDRRPLATTPSVEIVPPNPGIAELATQSSFLAEVEHPLASLTRTLALTGGLRRVVYSEASMLPDTVEQILTTTDDAPSVAHAVTVSATAGALRGGTFGRTEFVDAAHIDGELHVLRAGEITILDGLGPSLWLAADAATREELIAAALRDLDDPPEGIDPGPAVDAALQILIDRGLIVGS